MNESVHYLKSLVAVREQSHLLLANPTHLTSFDIAPACIEEVVSLVCDLIRRDYVSPSSIPSHSRWNHFTGVDLIRETYYSTPVDQAIELVDLIVVSVLLDAGAGDQWSYKSGDDVFCRSEGLALATLGMFRAEEHACDAKSLIAVTENALKKGFQVTRVNPLVGVAGRCALLNALGRELFLNKNFFPSDLLFFVADRCGGLVLYMLAHPKTMANSDGSYTMDLVTLWHVVSEGFAGIWPKRTIVDGVNLGDVWECKALADIQRELGLPDKRGLLPLHKLSQWMIYSLVDVFQRILNVTFVNLDLLTGNGGLLIDLGVLSLKPHLAQEGIPRFEASSDVIVEWRGLTVALLDLVAGGVRERLGLDKLPLAKILEAGTWKAGREVAAALREGKGPPIEVVSDGTIF